MSAWQPPFSSQEVSLTTQTRATRLADAARYAPREAPIMRGVAAERSDQRERLAAGGPQGSPEPKLSLPAEARRLHDQRFSFQVYLACAETKPHQSRGWNSLPGKAQSATGNRVLRCERQRP